MVAFVPADIPSNVNTVEKLVVWGNTILSDLYPDLTRVESAGQAVRLVQSGPFLIEATTPSQWVIISRSSLSLPSNWRRNGKIWVNVTDIGPSAIPPEYKIA